MEEQNKNIKKLSNKIELDVLLTTRCNLYCKHCLYVKKGVYVDLPEKILNKILLQLPRDKSAVHFLGGEPLLRKDILSIIKRTDKLGLKPQILTNGYILTNKFLKSLHEAGLETIGFSLDGTENIHNFIRGEKDVFRKVIDAIIFAKKLGYVPKICSTIHKKNKDSVLNLLPLLDKLNVGRVLIQYFFPVNKAKEYLNGNNLNPKEWNIFINKIKEIKKKNRLLLKIIVQKVFSSDKSRNKKFTCVCNNNQYPVIDAYGNYFPCILFFDANYPMGNIKNHTWKVLNSQRFTKEFLKVIAQKTSGYDDKKLRILCPAVRLMIVQKKLNLDNLYGYKTTMECFHNVLII